MPFCTVPLYRQIVCEVSYALRLCGQCVLKVLHDTTKQPGCFSLEAVVARRCGQQESNICIRLIIGLKLISINRHLK